MDSGNRPARRRADQRFRHLALAVALSAGLAGSPLAAKSVDEFLRDVDQLKAKGVGALWAPERKQLEATVATTSNAYRARLAAQRAAGQRPDSCPPPKGKLGIGGKQFIAELRALPAATRRGEFGDAFALLMRRHYPCK